MAILAFQKPDKVIMLEANDFQGKFEFRPLEPGFGITIGNALRRILLSSLEGYAITSIKIEGVDHEFATIPGVIDDVTNIILNLKQVRFRANHDKVDGEKLTLVASGREVVKAGDLNSLLVNFEVLNPELVLCNMDASASFKMELTIDKGRGYLPADEKVAHEIGIIPIDAIFTPIRNVKYTIENYRVEQKTDYEKLLLDIDTDGSIHPKEALKEAARILIQHFMLFSDEKIALDTTEGAGHEEFDEKVLRMRQLLKSKLVDLDLSVRAINCLKAADVETLGALCTLTRSELLKFRNFGKKSLSELEAKLASLNLSFGMDLSKYKLDKD
ncbi:MAG TPA: DNA-directed RNA polymerase subunit alpha [Paludibacteraceae bacterium]|nr:DNA-directed RNA polymerase subunit alpha [Paludibacteraceae bacterium]HQB68641.1 DNA-directed RNA polymerase subunit alpha [Paludibacteraceae bacterium]